MKKTAGIFTRARYRFWYLWLSTAPIGQQQEKTTIPVGTTPAERRDSRALAQTLYNSRMLEIAKRAHHIAGPANQTISFTDYSKTYDADTIGHHKGADRERAILIHLRAFFGDTPIAHIDTALVTQYTGHRLRQKTTGPKAARRPPTIHTVNREVDVLKSLMRDAAPTYFEKSPIAGMPRLRGTAPRRRRVTTDADEKRLLKQCDRVDAALYVLATDTLARLGDCLDLRRVDKHGALIDILDPKSGKPYSVPLSHRAERALDALKHANEFYFSKFRQAKNPRDWRGSVAKRFKRLAAKCTPPVAFGMDSGWTFHGATRKTGASRHARNGTPIAVTQKLGNWIDPTMLLKIYTEVDTADLYKAVGRKAPAAPKQPKPAAATKKRRSA